MKKTVLITGASRGLGLEFVRQYGKEGWQVIACCRQPERAEVLHSLAEQFELSIVPLDVSEPASVTSLTTKLAGRTLDVLINNAGMYGPRDASFGNTDFKSWAKVLATNTMAPLRLAEALAPNLACGSNPIIASITSKMGSITDNSSGGSYIYRSSKAALNMVNKSMAHDLAEQGIVCVVLHPGWVRTDMGGPNGLIDATESVQSMRRVIHGLVPEVSGSFFNYDGSRIAW